MLDYQNFLGYSSYVSQGNQEDTVTRKPKFVDVDEQIWARMKSVIALKRMTVTEAIEEAVEEWLERGRKQASQ